MKKNTLTNKIILLITGFIVIVFLIVAINNVRLLNGQTTDENGEAENVEITSNYFEYTPATLATAQENGRVVLFFAATKWCNTCAALDKELKEKSSELPDDITVLKIDYDNDKQKRDQYNATIQHTMILEDSNGKEIKRWIGGGIETLKAQIN